MNLFLLLLLAQPQAADSRLWSGVMQSLERSGRPVEIVEPRDARLSPPPLAPGTPPLLGFRYLAGKVRHRFGDLGLVMDDASH